MSFSANKLRISMGLPGSQFPILPRSHERTTGELAGLPESHVRTRLSGLSVIYVFLSECLMPSVPASRLSRRGESPRSRFLGSFTEHFDGLPTTRPSGQPDLTEADFGTTVLGCAAAAGGPSGVR